MCSAEWRDAAATYPADGHESKQSFLWLWHNQCVTAASTLVDEAQGVLVYRHTRMTPFVKFFAAHSGFANLPWPGQPHRATASGCMHGGEARVLR